jgi:hypothetical protein
MPGLFTRPVAPVLALEMAVASLRNSLEMATVLYSFLFLYAA